MVVSATPNTDRQRATGATLRPSPAGGHLVAWSGFAFGSLTSVAANVLAERIRPDDAGGDWQANVLAEFGAAVWPIMLLISVELLSRIRWPHGWQWLLARFGGAATVAVGSALISYIHIANVLHSWGYSPVAAHIGPLVIDGLMTISGFALLAAGQPGEIEDELPTPVTTTVTAPIVDAPEETSPPEAIVTPSPSGASARTVAAARTTDRPTVTAQAQPMTTNVVNLADGASIRHRMFAYLDKHPEASGAELDRVFDTKQYGRGVLRSWKTHNSHDAKASGE